jgi:general secretion pathway protein H
MSLQDFRSYHKNQQIAVGDPLFLVWDKKKRAIEGFTLIEILVVLLILGLTIGFALMAFGDFGESRRLLFSAEQLVNTLELAQQQAILETSTFALRIDHRGYEILKLKDENTWIPLSHTGVFKMNHFPKDTLVSLSPIQPAGVPSIIINSFGGLTPFILHLGTTKQADLVTLIGKANGRLILTSGHAQ